MRAWAASAVLAAALVGCGQQGGDTVTSTPEPSTPAPVAAPLPTSIPDELPEPLPGPNRPAKAAGQALTGTVVEGVEAGCLLLSTADGDYLLLGGDPSVVAVGARITVRGRTDPTVMSTCQQGIPFVVASATAD